MGAKEPDYGIGIQCKAQSLDPSGILVSIIHGPRKLIQKEYGEFVHNTLA